jgi:ligand-binding SRPBCC domain-containing protein
MNHRALNFSETETGSRLVSQLFLPVRRERVFGLFSDAFQLETLTPTWLKFSVQTPRPIFLREGSLIDYRLRIRGIPIRWQSRIDMWEPPFRFVDV